jgi:hypothetical protein
VRTTDAPLTASATEPAEVIEVGAGRRGRRYSDRYSISFGGHCSAVTAAREPGATARIG